MQIDRMRLIFYKDGAIGDIVVLVPLLLLLKERFPPISLTLVTNECYVSPFLARIGVIDSRISSSSGEVYEVFAESGRSKFLESLPHDRIFFISNRIPSSNLTKERVLIPPFPAGDFKKFTAFYYIREVFAGLGADSPSHSWDFFRELMREKVLSAGIAKPEKRESIAFHPGSGSRSKNLKPDCFVNLLDSISGRKYRKALILGPAETELTPKAVLDSYSKRVDTVFVSPDIESLVGLLLGTKFYFGMDSGITHLANLLSENVISFFGASSPVLWSPNTGSVKAVTLSRDRFMQETS